MASADKAAARKKRLIALGFGFLAFALFVELGATWYPDGFPVSAHSWPPACLARYGIGYVAGCCLLSLDSKMDARKMDASGKTALAISEVSTTAVVLLATGTGPVSRLLSIKVLRLPARWELEFYALHQPVLQLMASLFSSACTRKVYVITAFVATAALPVTFKFIQGHIHGAMRVSPSNGSGR